LTDLALESPQEAKLYLDQNMVDGESHCIGGGVAAVYSARCPGKETPNEDAAALIPLDADCAVLVVADGLGGVRAGEQAASLAVKAMKRAVAKLEGDGAALRSAILDGFEEANRAVQELGVGAATTLAVVELNHGAVRPYHVGDSMILVCGQRGKLKLLTVSHSPVGFAVEAGLLDAEEAMHHEDRHLISNVIGTPGMRIEVGPTLKLAPRDTLLLASDGLFDNLHTDEIVDTVRKGPLGKATQQLAHVGAERMQHPTDGLPSKPDDLTFVAFRRKAGKTC
jgi:serine/threonine protein phosphatase PrpC